MSSRPLSPKQEAFLAWWLLPKESRGGTQAQWCLENDVNPSSPAQWRKLPAWKEALEKAYHEINVGADKIQAVVDAMHAAATAGDTKAASLYLQYCERLKPQTLIVESKSVREMTDEELEASWQGLAAVPD